MGTCSVAHFKERMCLLQSVCVSVCSMSVLSARIIWIVFNITECMCVWSMSVLSARIIWIVFNITECMCVCMVDVSVECEDYLDCV